MNTTKKQNLYYFFARTMLVVLVFGIALFPKITEAALGDPVTSPVTPPVTSPVTPPVTPPMEEEFVITTSTLPNGKVGRNYRVRIVGTSSLSGQDLVFMASGLPQGLEIGRCRTRSRYNTQLGCLLYGQPIEAGNFMVELTLVNVNSGASTSVLLPLEIIDSPRI